VSCLFFEAASGLLAFSDLYLRFDDVPRPWGLGDSTSVDLSLSARAHARVLRRATLSVLLCEA
jgi:hypothetical protein